MQVNWKHLLRNFIIELVLYGILVVVYFFIVLRFLGDWLLNLFQEQPVLYGFLALILIVAQGVVLEAITSFLIERLNLGRAE